MAIIICKNCKKKVSDTVDKCIHCGQNPKEEIAEEKVEEAPAKEAPPKKAIEYYDLSEKEQVKLEAEFVKQDKSAKRYLLDTFELSSFMKPVFFYLVLTYLAIRLISLLVDAFGLVLTTDVVNEQFSTIAAVSGIGLVALCVCMFIYGLIKKIYNRVTQAQLVYFKKFQKWLKKNKNIDFYPELKKARQKAFFEAIDIE